MIGWAHLTGMRDVRVNNHGQLIKGLIYLALADPQEFFQQHLMKKEEQPSFGERYSVHFGEESALLLFCMS